jgi:hypothetical protein
VIMQTVRARPVSLLNLFRRRVSERKNRHRLAGDRGVSPSEGPTRPYRAGALQAEIKRLQRSLRQNEKQRHRQIVDEAAQIYRTAWVVRGDRDELLDFCRLDHWKSKRKGSRPALDEPNEVLHHLLGLLYDEPSQRSKLSKLRKALCGPFSRRVSPEAISSRIRSSGGIEKMAERERRAAKPECKAAPVAKVARPSNEPPVDAHRHPAETVRLDRRSPLIALLEKRGGKAVVEIVKREERHVLVRVRPLSKEGGASPIVTRFSAANRNLRTMTPALRQQHYAQRQQQPKHEA